MLVTTGCFIAEEIVKSLRESTNFELMTFRHMSLLVNHRDVHDLCCAFLVNEHVSEVSANLHYNIVH